MGQYTGPVAPDERVAMVRWVNVDGMKSDATDGSGDLTNWVRGIYVGGTGTLIVIDWYGVELTFVGLAAGMVHMIPAKRIKATGTTCTYIMGCY